MKPSIRRSLRPVMTHNNGTSWQLGEYVPPEPLWWDIPTLPRRDIVDVWTFDADNGVELVGEVNGLTWQIIEGGPSIHPGQGFNFGGAGLAAVTLPAGLSTPELSFVMQYDNGVRNGTLDAFLSWYDTETDNIIYTLQNNFDSNLVRWSCGGADATTIEMSRTGLETGIYGASGERFYFDGEFKNAGDPGTGGAIPEGKDFYLGAIRLGDGRTKQYVKARIKKLIIVRRKLTDEEQWELYFRIQ